MTKKLIIILSLISSVANAAPMRKVAILDTGLDINDSRFAPYLCVSGHRDFTNTGLQDTDGHGTHIAGLIVSHAKKSNFCLIIYKVLVGGTHETAAAVYEPKAIKHAIEQHASIINISAGGPSFSHEEYGLIKQHPEVLIVAATGNDGLNLDVSNNKFYPASYKLPNVIPVGMLTRRMKRDPRSNYAEDIQWEMAEQVLSTVPRWCDNTGCANHKLMSGTSQAAAIHTGKLISSLNVAF